MIDSGAIAPKTFVAWAALVMLGLGCATGPTWYDAPPLDDPALLADLTRARGTYSAASRRIVRRARWTLRGHELQGTVCVARRDDGGLDAAFLDDMGLKIVAFDVAPDGAATVSKRPTALPERFVAEGLARDFALLFAPTAQGDAPPPGPDATRRLVARPDGRVGLIEETSCHDERRREWLFDRATRRLDRAREVHGERLVREVVFIDATRLTLTNHALRYRLDLWDLE